MGWYKVFLGRNSRSWGEATPVYPFYPLCPSWKPMIVMARQLRVAIISVCILLASLSTAGGAAADSDVVVVKGTRLEGRILSFDSEGIRMDTVYAKGDILIAYEDIEFLQSRGEYHLIDKDGQEFLGQILGIKDGQLGLGESWDKAILLDPSTISRGIAEITFQSSFTERWRTRYPWWSGDLHLGWNIEQTAIDKVKVTAGLNLERRKKPTRLVGDVQYALDRQGTEPAEYQTTKDELRAFVLVEYDLSKQWFSFLYPALEWDEPRGIEVRTYPSAGVGFRFVETEKSLLQLQLGPGYVYEDFLAFSTNDYFAIHFGFEARHTFWRYLRFSMRMLYMPGVPDADVNWIYRAELDLSVPITDLLSMRLGFTETNDNNPSEGVGNNKFTTTLGFSLTY